MMDKHDFKGTLNDINEIYETSSGKLTVIQGGSADKAIQEALKIADRLRSGEVSAGMLEIAFDYERNENYTPVQAKKFAFKAMAQKLLKEVEND